MVLSRNVLLIDAVRISGVKVMTYQLEKREPEVAYQQILLPDASVYSVQWLDVPAQYASRITTPLLLELYFDVVRECTCQLIRPTVTAQGVQFRLVGTSLALLSFFPAQLHAGQGGGAVHLCICGGLFVWSGECDRGTLSLLFEAREAAEVRVTVQLSEYYPLLLGRTPSTMRKLLYRLTQGCLHKVVTIGFLSRLYRELTGVKVRARVKKVQISEGEEI